EGGVRRGREVRREPKEKQCFEVVKTILVTPSNVFFEHLSSAASVMRRVCALKFLQTVTVPLGPIATVFTEEEERELVEYLKETEGRFEEKGEAGKHWIQEFLRRHPDLSLRKPAGFNRVSVGRFFELLGQTLDMHAFTPDRIYNCDETGVSVVPKTRSKVIAATGKKQLGVLTSAERGTTITIEICFNAAVSYMPPMFIFPRKRMKRELLYGAPPNSSTECFETGWITAEIFLAWFKKFVQFTNASKANPIILLLDGHASHTKPGTY
ncbi:hypothetical protein ILUMI_25927, partial [Ignelater luminosus]